jgi:putative ATP-dependent endonuclease of OLD family
LSIAQLLEQLETVLARIRKVDIRNFRSIKSLDWAPAAGLNCLIGPGDSGKSTVLDAIDLCLGARRNVTINDTDFFGLDVAQPISISLTLGALPDALKNLNVYGEFLRGYNSAAGDTEEEPRHGLETVLVLRLQVSDDLEPHWSLVSERANEQGLERGISWKDRLSIAPARLGAYGSSNLSWTRGSVLNRLSSERANLGAELANASREARLKFGEQAEVQFAEALQTVTNTANSLGIHVGTSAKALLDAHAVSIGDGAVALHNENGIPLRALGTGSVRLLTAGLQRAASESASIVLIDEIEYGLEPHRLTLLLDSLGAKDATMPLQVFMTTHSPVAVRELNGDQVLVMRALDDVHVVRAVGNADDVQSTLRAVPEAFLARTVIVCEGASEVGLIRGLDQYFMALGHRSLLASGTSYVDVGGSNPDRCFNRGRALLALGYRAIVLVDADKPPTPEIVSAFQASGGKYISWEAGRALEDELFLSLPDAAVCSLIRRALELTDDGVVDAHIVTQSHGATNLAAVLAEGETGSYSVGTRTLLGLASRTGKNGWFKSVTKFQGVGRDIVGPYMREADDQFFEKLTNLLGWAHA